MPLSDDDRRGLLDDAQDPRRREVLRRFRRRGQQMSPADYLRFLQSASDLLAANRPPRPRRRAFGARYFLL